MESDPKGIYRGIQDIPFEHRASQDAQTEPRQIAPVSSQQPTAKESVLAQIAEARDSQRKNVDRMKDVNTLNKSSPGKKKSDLDL